MTDPRERSVAAAGRLLDACAVGADVSTVRVELAGWLVGAGGSNTPRLPDPAHDLHARLAALLGAGDHAAAEAFIAEHGRTVPGERLLFAACSLAGEPMADALVELAHRLESPWFSGPMLTRTSRPDRLLALFSSPLQRHAVATVGELVIAGRDSGATIEEAEARWAEIAAQPYYQLSYMSEYCDATVRISAREDLEQAIDLLETFEEPDRPGHVFDGAHAVFARLMRSDPARAASVAGAASSPQDRVIRLGGLAWWFDLPEAAAPFVDELLDVADPYVALSLVRILAACRDPRLDRALVNVAAQPLLETADRLALGAHALRVAGRHDDAELVRVRSLAALPGDLVGRDEIAPLDVFDVISAPGRPTLAPWRTPPGLPHECP